MNFKITKKAEYLSNSCAFISKVIGGSKDTDFFLVYDIGECFDSITGKIPCHEVKYLIRNKSDYSGCVKRSYIVSKKSESTIVKKINAVLRGLKYMKLIEDEYVLDTTSLDDSARKKLQELRTKQNEFNADAFIYEMDRRYAIKFKAGDLINYNNSKGIIDEKLSDRLYRIKIKDDFFEVDGMKLKLRERQDLSHIPIDPKLNKLETKNLLRMLKSCRKQGKLYGDGMKIKRILSEREHVKSK